MSPHIDRAIAERARTQLGLVTRTQLRADGVSRAALSRRVASGALVPVTANVLRLGGAPDEPRMPTMAACLDLGAVASHRTALWLHDLAPRPPLTDVTVRKGRSTGITSTRDGVRVHTSTNLPRDDVVRVGPIPTTSVARTLMGVAALAEVDDEALLGLVEEAVRRRLATDRWLWWVLEQRRCRGRDGVRRFEAVLARRAELGPTESWLEREVLRLLTHAGLPLPRVQARIRRRGAFVARVDLLYEDEGVVLEALGHAAHASRSQQSADAARASELQLLGLEVHQVTYDQVVRQPEWVVHLVRRALARSTRRAA